MASGSAKEKKKKHLAEESSKTKKAREKLMRQLEAVEKKITVAALEKKALEIHRWIARHAQHRVVLRSKAISLFDENQNTAKLSYKVASLVDQISGKVEKVSDLSLRKIEPITTALSQP